MGCSRSQAKRCPIIVISHLVDKELRYKSYLNVQHIGITNGDSKFLIHDLLTPVTIILVSLKLNKMLNVKTEFDTFQALGKEEFSKRTNTHSWKGCDHAKY